MAPSRGAGYEVVHHAILGAKYDRLRIWFPVANLCKVNEVGDAGSASEVDSFEIIYVTCWMHCKLCLLLLDGLGPLSLLFVAIPVSKYDFICSPPCENSINRRAYASSARECEIFDEGRYQSMYTVQCRICPAECYWHIWLSHLISLENSRIIWRAKEVRFTVSLC